jgi:hypothetical protein
LEVPKLKIGDVYALGGYSSDRITLAREIFGREPSESDLQYFDYLLQRTGEKLGPTWIDSDAKDRVVRKILAVVERLRPYAKK